MVTSTEKKSFSEDQTQKFSYTHPFQGIQDTYLACRECHTATPGSDVHLGFILQPQLEVSRLPSIPWDLQLKAEKDLSSSKTRTSRMIPIQRSKTEPLWKLPQIHVQTLWNSVVWKLQAWDKPREAALLQPRPWKAFVTLSGSSLGSVMQSN